MSGPVRWRDVENLRPHLDPIVDELSRMPGQRELTEMGRCDLVGGVYKFGGFPSVAKALDYPYRWCTCIEDLRPQLDPIVAELGRMPTAAELRLRKRWDIINALLKFGGFRRAADLFGYHYASTVSFWNDVEDLRPHLDPIVKVMGRMPRSVELSAFGRYDLTNAIVKLGGQRLVAEILGYPNGDNIYHSMLERRVADPLLRPLGFEPQLRVPGERHPSDYGRLETRRVVEINGCRWHDHRVIKPGCPVLAIEKVSSGQSPRDKDEYIRRLAVRLGLMLLELWECERPMWPEQVDAWLTSKTVA